MNTSPFLADLGFGPYDGVQASIEGLASYGKRMEAARNMGAVAKWGLSILSNVRELQFIGEDPALRERWREMMRRTFEDQEWLQDEIDELLWVSDGWRVL